jgi:hypothetical protein
MDSIDRILLDPRAVAAIIALLTALAALARAEAARVAAGIALRRTGGRRQTPAASAAPPVGQPDRRVPK